MLKMDTHTKQVFLSGVFVYLSTVSGLILKSVITEAEQNKDITYLKQEAKVTNLELKLLAADMGNLRTKSATVEVMLTTLNKSVTQLDKTTTELGKIAARLDERSKEIR